jgi:hypothetical protein
MFYTYKLMESYRGSIDTSLFMAYGLVCMSRSVPCCLYWSHAFSSQYRVPDLLRGHEQRDHPAYWHCVPINPRWHIMNSHCKSERGQSQCKQTCCNSTRRGGAGGGMYTIHMDTANTANRIWVHYVSAT